MWAKLVENINIGCLILKQVFETQPIFKYLYTVNVI